RGKSREPCRNLSHAQSKFPLPCRPGHSGLCCGMSAIMFDPKRPRIAMVSTHGYVAANPPLGAADTGGQVVYVLELAKKLGQLGYDVDIWTRQFEDQPEIDIVNGRVRVLRVPCGGKKFIPK